MTMRIVLAAGFVLAAMSFDLRPVQASEGPWCAFLSLGAGSVYQDCRYNSVEECRSNVLAGNRGFCNLNPRWAGRAEAPAEPRTARKHHTQLQ